MTVAPRPIRRAPPPAPAAGLSVSAASRPAPRASVPAPAPLPPPSAPTAPPLRFAPLIRVSTEQQEKQGESLSTQRKQIIEYVNRLGGVIPDACWRYCGQEHATPGHERVLLDALLCDASKGLFDAVIVCDVSRWSRDNVKSKTGLEILRGNGIRFFVGSCEHELSSPAAHLYLGISTEFNEFQARMQTMRSLENRINRAKRGMPACGKLPFGRTFDASKDGVDKNGVHRGWGIDPEKSAMIRSAAQEYLAGGSLPKIALKNGVNAANLWKVLTRRSGDTWEQSFNYPKANIHEVVITKVPRLLPQEMIETILKTASSNKTYAHGEIKHRYLFSRMVFCEGCGLVMFGQTNHGTRRYYRHSRPPDKRCDRSLWVPADDLEVAVFAHLFSLMGDVAGMERAIEAAIPDKAKLAELRRRRTVLIDEVRKNAAAKDRLLGQLTKGTIEEADFERAMPPLRERGQLLAADLALVENQLAEVPGNEERRQRVISVETMMKHLYRTYAAYTDMPYEDKRKLAELVFGGKTPEGKRCGIYVSRTGNPKRPWQYTLRGNLPEVIEGLLPIRKGELEDLLGTELEEGEFGRLTKSAYNLPGTAPRGCRSPPGTR